MPYRIKSTLPPAAPVGKAKLDPNWRVAAARTQPDATRLSFRMSLAALRRAHLPAPARRKDPLEEAGGDRSKMRALTLHDIVQCVASRRGIAAVLRAGADAPLRRRRSLLRTTDEETYGSPPEKPLVRAARALPVGAH